MIPAIIFADFQGELNYPAALLTIKGRYFLEHLKDRITIAKLGPTYIYTGSMQDKFIDRIDTDILDKKISVDLSAIMNAAVEKSEEKAGGIFIFSVTQPLISSRLLRKMAETFLQKPDNSLMPSFRNEKGSPFIITRKDFIDAVDQGQTTFLDLFNRTAVNPTLLPVEDERILIHVKTIDDYETYLSRHKVLLSQNIL